MADVQGFIQQFGPVAAAVSQRIGVAPDVLLGQWGLETGWGKSIIPGTNNLGNIKGQGVAAKDNQTGAVDQYRAYPSPLDFGNDFVNLIANRYQGAVGKGADATAYAGALKAGGYAEDPKYVGKLSSAVDMVRKFGDTIASALSGSANANELTPAQMGGAPVISATGQRLNGPQTVTAPAQSAPAADASTGDPLLDMAHGIMGGTPKSTSQAPAAGAVPLNQPAQQSDDPLMAMAAGVMAGKGGAANAAQAALVTNGSRQSALQPTISGQPWQTPGSVTMGIGDAIKGGVQSLVHGGAWLANKVAPDSQFAKDINAAVPQIDQTIQAQNTQYAADRAAQQPQTLTGIVTGKRQAPGVDWGRMAGNVIGAAPLAATLPAGSGVLGSIGAGALSGAASSLLEPVTTPGNFLQQKLGQAATGAAVGGVANPLVKALGAAISPTVGAAQQRMLDSGVTMTPGQILGGGFARTEAKLSSVPFLGDMIKNAQQRTLQDFNRATYNEVLAPIGATYEGPAGQEAIGAVRNAIRDAYDDSLGRMSFQAADPGFQADILRLTDMAQQLPAAQRQTFMNTLRTQIFGKVGPQGNMDGQTLKGVQEELGDLARGYSGDPSFDNRQLGAAIGEIRSAVENSLARTNPADAVEGLANANAAYARFARMRAAAASQGAMNNEGIFTAAQLQNAVKAGDRSAGKGATATGNALMQDFSTAAQSVLGSKYPDSGTAGRGLMALLAPGSIGAGLATAPLSTLGTLGGIGLGALPYTGPGQRLAQALLTARPGFAVPVRNGLSQFVAPLAAPTGNALINAIAPSK
ncbi:glucosaminidase domain-containing protein [Burkholderia sp. AU45274]|uniref:glycoside hydrolase family 73 protein n=1 Tax=Burkholderia sp. AU45274 TaxID=3059205 RepID=UPI00264D9017|nr:glucosaminidase domain-containing protein [Burkholderia sp. AU45274]MDN7489514.1 glucosaminidase domain-containing protein [Burkholderia sp. AU45274]